MFDHTFIRYCRTFLKIYARLSPKFWAQNYKKNDTNKQKANNCLKILDFNLKMTI